IVPIRWKGEEMGAVGIVRLRGLLEPDERELLDALALEVGAALQNAQLYQEAVRLADRDGLTDLLNHRVIQQQLSVNLARAQRSSSDLAVIIMDMKNFKFFNDTYGHQVGDRVLQTVSRCLRDACRVTDILGRYGGDEFIALLPDTDIQGTITVCSRIAARVEKEGYQQANDGRRIPIALSFGAAFFPQDGDSALELLAAANSNLEEAKNANAPLLVQRTPVEEAQELRRLKDASVGGAFGVLDALVTAIDNKDHYTRRHSEDVTHWATLMARELDFSEETQRAVRIAGLLHDVGKIAVPDSVLRKPGRLNDDEFNIMQQHPVFGALIVKDVPNLEEVLGGIRHHHERYDGKGYPDKLKGETIPMMGRLLAVPDCFSAMTTERPYRKALSWHEATSEIERGKSTQFDPVMANAFLAVIARLLEEQKSQQTLLGPSGQELNGDGTAALTPSDGALTTPTVRPRSVTDAETT
ncbi:MAG: diguanylate cyclase, partial [Abitibacteriaceae bacterium]|nr:diguanylate cyclase [Abditibacteriaceae bacterium]